MIHYFYGTLQVGIGQTLCSFEHVSCLSKNFSCLRQIAQNLFTIIVTVRARTNRKPHRGNSRRWSYNLSYAIAVAQIIETCSLIYVILLCDCFKLLTYLAGSWYH